MMRLKKSFTIMELLISLSLSSFIMLGMMQTYRNVVRYLETSREMMNTNRKVCLLFNQLERDFSSTLIPDVHEEEKQEKGAAGKPEEKEEDKAEEKDAVEETEKKNEKKDEEKLSDEEKKKAEKKAKMRKSYFIASPDDRTDPIKIGDKKYELFKQITFICTNPLQVFGEKMVRQVRVKYELTVDKEKSKGEQLSYKLWRKETTDLANVNLTLDQEAPKEKVKPVRTHLIADNLKSFFIEYVSQKKPKKKDKEAGQPAVVEVRSFKWGDKKEFEGIVPQRVEVYIEFWNEALSASYSFNTVFPIYSYPTPSDKKKKKKKAVGQAPESPEGEGGGKVPPTPPENPEIPTDGGDLTQQMGAALGGGE